ncbi:MAG: alanine racemase [Longimicrobiales bacterium]|nr:alanine racemase [Longimicrobiales bacterium]
MAISDTRAWVEVDLDALRANYDTVRRTAGTAVLPMVKADGYGVGAARVIRALEPRDPWGYGVATAAEGAELRELGVERPILVMSPLPAGDVEAAAAAGLTASISSLAGLDAWARAAEAVDDGLDFHVEIDTGMGRSGFDWRRIGAWGPAVRDRTGPALRWAGVFTHFHSADASAPDATVRQWERFGESLVQLPVPERAMVHASASAAALRWPEYRLDAVRPGIFLYGGDPAPGVEAVPKPEPVVAVRARLLLVRTVPAGSTVGYGATYTAGSDERWGTLAIGYGDGVPRALGNRGRALVRGRRVPIIGRVSMDLITVRLDDVPEAAPGDVVTLIGRDGEETITVDDVAGQVGTIGYEVLTGLSPRLPRFARGSTEESETA